MPKQKLNNEKKREQKNIGFNKFEEKLIKQAMEIEGKSSFAPSVREFALRRAKQIIKEG